MSWTVLETCCRCYSLRHGSIVIGIAFMISSAVVLLMEVGIIAEWADVQDRIHDAKMAKSEVSS